jgi:hypothetical protein
MHAARAKTIGTRRSEPAADPWQALPAWPISFDSQTPQPFFKGSKVSAVEELALTETKLLEHTASILGVSLAQVVKADTKVPIAPAKLATRAVTGPNRLELAQDPSPRITCLQARRHLRCSRGPSSLPPLPSSLLNQNPHLKPSYRNLLPKPLRNPKTNPELLADDPKNAKTALKPSDPAKAQKRAALLFGMDRPSRCLNKGTGSPKCVYCRPSLFKAEQLRVRSVVLMFLRCHCARPASSSM